MHSNVTIKNVSWPHFSWATLYRIYNVSLKLLCTIILDRQTFVMILYVSVISF